MTTLAPSTDYTGASVTQGGKKTFISTMRTFIADLFGTDSTMSTAHAAFKNYDVGTLRNVGIAASVGASALTIALKDAAGNDPSATSPVLVGMRSATLGTGTATLRAATAAQSIVIPSTATMGQSNGVSARLWLALIDNAGTLELAVLNTQLGNGQIHPVNESGLISTTALSAAADNAGVWYSTTARANVPFRLIGYIENTQATAGTWATAPSVIQPMGPGVRKPGDTVQRVFNFVATSVTDTTTVPADNTVPQITEGAQYLSQAVTPMSAINTLRIEAQWIGASNAAAGTVVAAALFQDAGANALKATPVGSAGASVPLAVRLLHMMRAGTTSATTMSVRAGASAAGTTTFNGSGGTQLFGGVADSYLEIEEIMA